MAVLIPSLSVSSTTRIHLPDTCFNKARDLPLDLRRVLQPPLEIVRDGARPHLRSDEGAKHEATVHILTAGVGVGEQAAGQVVAVPGWLKARESVTLEAAGSSTRGSKTQRAAGSRQARPEEAHGGEAAGALPSHMGGSMVNAPLGSS